MEELYQEELDEREDKEDGSDYLEGIAQDQFENLDIIHLFGKEKLENIQRMISKATGLAFVTVDYKGEPITEPTSFTRFCRTIRSNKEVGMRCKASDAFGAIQAAVTQKPSVYFCPCGLIEVAIPIVLKGHYLGGFIGGQIRCNDAPEDVSQLKKVMPSPTETLSKEEYDSLIQEIPVYSYEKFQDIANLVFLIINQLSENEVGLHMQKEAFQKKFKKLYAGNQKHALEIKKKEERLRELTARMNPYLMLDLMTTLVNLSIMEGAVKTNAMMMLMTDYIRYAYMEGGMTSLSKEMEHIEKFLRMEKEKFGERLEYIIKIPQTLSMQRIPAGVLMPFIENAIFFGTALNREGGLIKVTGKLFGGRIALSVEDSGPGLGDEELKIKFDNFGRDYEGYYIWLGMENAQQLMKNIFKDEFEVVTECAKGVGRQYQLIWPEHFSERVDL